MSRVAVLLAAKEIHDRAAMKPGVTVIDQGIAEAKKALENKDVGLAFAKLTLAQIADYQWGVRHEHD